MLEQGLKNLLLKDFFQFLNNGNLNNKMFCVYKLTFKKKAMASHITGRVSGFGASAAKKQAINSLTA